MKMLLCVKWLLRCSLLLACSGTLAAPRLGGLGQSALADLQQIDNPADQESFNFMVPPRHVPSLTWSDVIDPRLYLYGDLDTPEEARDTIRLKRIPQLSIDSPIETLRERLRLEIAREQQEMARQMREKQVEKNRNFLNQIGKRSIPQKDDPRDLSHQDN